MMDAASTRSHGPAVAGDHPSKKKADPPSTQQLGAKTLNNRVSLHGAPCTESFAKSEGGPHTLVRSYGIWMVKRAKSLVPHPSSRPQKHRDTSAPGGPIDMRQRCKGPSPPFPRRHPNPTNPFSLSLRQTISRSRLLSGAASLPPCDERTCTQYTELGRPWSSLHFRQSPKKGPITLLGMSLLTTMGTLMASRYHSTACFGSCYCMYNRRPADACSCIPVRGGTAAPLHTTGATVHLPHSYVPDGFGLGPGGGFSAAATY